MLSYRNSLLQLLPDDDAALGRLDLVEDRWRHLVEDIASAEQRLSAVQLALLPSTQALNELQLFLNGVVDTLQSDEDFRPKTRDEVNDFNEKYTVCFGNYCCVSSLHRIDEN